MNRHTLSALVENKFGVLARVAGMLSGRGFNIETLNVGPTHDPKLSRITATVVADGEALERCVRQLDKLVNVISVEDFSKADQFVARELLVIKVAANKSTRSEIIEIADIFRAKIVDVAIDSLTIEFTGNETKATAFLDLMTPHGILESARTGRVALRRGNRKAPASVAKPTKAAKASKK